MDYEYALECLRSLAATLPESSETETFGNPTFKAGKKTFAVIERHQDSGDDSHTKPSVLSFKVDPEFQRVLCEDERFSVAPYVGRHGWTYALLNEIADWNEVEGFVIESYRLAALKRMLKALDEAQD